MTKTQRVLAALALAAGASTMAVSGASAAGHTPGHAPVPPEPAASASAADAIDQIQAGLHKLNELNQLMAVPNHIAPLTDPVVQVVGALQ